MIYWLFDNLFAFMFNGILTNNLTLTNNLFIIVDFKSTDQITGWKKM